MARISKRILGISAALLLVAATSARAQETKMGKSKESAKAGAKPVIWAAADLKWEDIAGGAPGVKVATLWGDSSKGPHGAIHKFPSGFAAPLHTHSSDLHAVVISGTVIHGPEGGPEKKLTAGSYLFTPSTYKHTTRCDTGSECLLFIDAKGKFDVKMVEGK